MGAPPSSSSTDRMVVVPVAYHAMRMLRFKVALRDFLRRWGVYLAITVALAGAGSNAPVAVAAALAGTLVGPLMIAAEHRWWIVPMVFAYAIAGALPVVFTRPLWWPRGWASAERALPVAADVVDRSDRIFCWIVSGPWQAVLLVGAIGLWSNGAASQDAWIVVGGDIVAAVGSQRLALQWMRHVRRAAGSQEATTWAGVRASRRRTAVAFTTIAPVRALVWMPLVRGRATRSASALIAGSVATVACGTARLWSALTTGWSLVLLAVVALAATTALRPCTGRDLQPGWRGHRELPLDARRCERARMGVVLLPTLVGIVVSFIVLALAPGQPRLRVLGAYGLVLAVGCGIEATTRETMQPSNHAARWILTVALAIAFASEVTPP